MTLSSVDLTKRLDELERALPPIPAKSMAFGRATVRRTNDVVSSVVSGVARRVDRMAGAVRSGASTTVGQTRQAGERTTDTAATAMRQTAGQARSAAERTRKAAKSAVAETVGQARSGAARTARVAESAAKRARTTARTELARTADTVTDETEDLLDDATSAVDPDTPARGTEYEQWTKSQLYDRAQELDIEGRSTMSKQELITALRAA